MKKLEIFLNRMSKLGINITLFGNYPWIYIDSINGKRVTETFQGNHGFTLMFYGEYEFTNIKKIFKIIRKYK